MKTTEASNEPTHVALYIRVSDEEQKIKGLSLEAHNCNWLTTDEEYNTSTAKLFMVLLFLVLILSDIVIGHYYGLAMI